MLFGPRYTSYPTPFIVGIFAKLIIRLCSFVLVVIELIPMGEGWHKFWLAFIAFIIGGVNDVKDWFAVKVPSEIPKEAVKQVDEEKLKDSSVKITIWWALVFTYYLLF